MATVKLNKAQSVSNNASELLSGKAMQAQQLKIASERAKVEQSISRTLPEWLDSRKLADVFGFDDVKLNRCVSGIVGAVKTVVYDLGLNAPAQQVGLTCNVQSSKENCVVTLLAPSDFFGKGRDAWSRVTTVLSSDKLLNDFCNAKSVGVHAAVDAWKHTADYSMWDVRVSSFSKLVLTFTVVDEVVLCETAASIK